MKFLRVLLASLLIGGAAHAQGASQLGAGQILGNPTGSRAPGTATNVGAIFDQYYSCSARGSILFRGASNLTCLGPGTAGLPLTSGGAGGDLSYSIVALSAGGLGGNNTAANGGIFYSDATRGRILAPTATAQQMLQSGANAAPAWSTATWPSTTTINQILYSSAANLIGGIATMNNGVMISGGAGIPVFAGTLPCANFPALSGDISTVANACATTLATVNANVGSWGTATQVPQFTVNAKGLITAVANVTITPAFSSITGQATLAQFPNIASNTVLANVTGGSAVPTAATPSAILDTLTTCSTQGSVMYRNATTWVCLGPGSSGQVLQSGGAAANPSWLTVSGTGTVTTVGWTGGIVTVTNPTTTPAFTIAGTSGGIPYFSSTSTWASSGLLTQNALVLGGGAGAAPTPMGSLGTTTTVLHGNAAGAPTFAAVAYADIASGDLASSANYLAGTASKLVNSGVIYQGEVTVTYGTTTTFDFSLFNNAVVTLTGNITTMTLSNVTAGKSGSITFIQDGTGSRTSVFSTTFKFAGGTVPTLTTTANAIDILDYHCRTSTFCQAALAKDVRNP